MKLSIFQVNNVYIKRLKIESFYSYILFKKLNEVIEVIDTPVFHTGCKIGTVEPEYFETNESRVNLINLLSFIDDYDISDLHDANIGYIGMRPVLVDYSSFND